jgi:nitroreductase
MNTWDAVRTIRVVRSFRPDPIPPELLERIVDAGRHAGSSKNLQRWAFITVTDRERLRQLSEVGRYAGHLAGAAAGIALVTPDPSGTSETPGPPLSVMWDLGRAAQNMVLTAWEAGVGSVPATVYDHDLARRLLGYPEDRHCEYILSFGYPADPADLTRPPKKGGRSDLDEVLHRERW